MRSYDILYIGSMFVLATACIGRWFMDAPFEKSVIWATFGVVLWILAEVQELHGKIEKRDKSVSE